MAIMKGLKVTGFVLEVRECTVRFDSLCRFVVGIRDCREG